MTNSISVDIPEGVTTTLEGFTVVAKGKNGELRREFRHPQVKLTLEGGKFTLATESERRKIRALLGTWSSVVKNMLLGVKSGWRCDMKLIHSHFNAKIGVKDNNVVIQDFIGERKPRVAKIISGVNVKVDKESVVITGPDKERVGQMGGKIEKTTRIIGFDRRVFQDGCYITKKPYLMDGNN